MRILIVNTFYYPEVKGGAEYSVKKLAEGLVASGHNVLVLAAGTINTDSVVDNVHVCRRKFKSIYHSYGKIKKNFFNKILHRILEFYNPFNEQIIKTIIDEFKPDVIHTNNIYEITPIIWSIAKKENIKIVHTIRDYYLMCPKTNLLNKNNKACEIPNIFCKTYQHINRKYTTNVDILTTPSAMMMQQILKWNFFDNSKKVVIYNACDFKADVVSSIIHEKIKKKSTKITFVYLGGLYKHKGINFLLNSFCSTKNDNIKLIIAGRGVELNNVKKATIEDNRISYIGFLNENEIDHLLKKCDVLICPSLWNEPFGRVILDAYKHGLPVIATKVGGLPELVDDEKTGKLIEPLHQEQLISILQYLGNNPSIINRYRENLLNKLFQYDIAKQITEFEKLYAKQ